MQRWRCSAAGRGMGHERSSACGIARAMVRPDLSFSHLWVLFSWRGSRPGLPWGQSSVPPKEHIMRACCAEAASVTYAPVGSHCHCVNWEIWRGLHGGTDEAVSLRVFVCVVYVWVCACVCASIQHMHSHCSWLGDIVGGDQLTEIPPQCNNTHTHTESLQDPLSPPPTTYSLIRLLLHDKSVMKCHDVCVFATWHPQLRPP